MNLVRLRFYAKNPNFVAKIMFFDQKVVSLHRFLRKRNK